MMGLSVQELLGGAVGAGLALVIGVVMLDAGALVALTIVGQWNGSAARLAARLAEPHRPAD
ncbi:MAG TPA: hypothetical protein VII06_00005 [Chloroflexota bacterium]|jgi:hypothetical protein